MRYVGADSITGPAAFARNQEYEEAFVMTSSNEAAVGLYVIFGQDEFPVSEKAQALVDRLVPPEDRSLGLEIVDGRCDTSEQAVNALRQCISALQTVGLLAGNKVVWLRDSNFFDSGALGGASIVKEYVERLTELLRAGLPPGQTLVITASRIDGRSAFCKACKASGEVHEFDIPDKGYKAEELARRHAVEALKKAGLAMSRDTLDAFLDRVGVETRQIMNEVAKLDVFVGTRRKVSPDDVEAVTCVSREAAVWDLSDAIGERNLGKALKTLQQLLFQKESAVGLVMVLERQLRELMIVREALDKGWLHVDGRGGRSSATWNLPREIEEVFDRLGRRDPRKIHPYRMGRIISQGRLFSLSELAAARIDALAAHERIVSTGVPQSLILELLFAKLLCVTASRNRSVSGLTSSLQ